jgi:hypothetical protein
LPPSAAILIRLNKIRKGTSHEGVNQISAAIRADMDKQWTTLIAPICGAKDYNELRHIMNARL